VTTDSGHALWVRICHWILAASALTLAVSGVVILMAHPRLYWGEVGNDLTPAWVELPISHNHRPEGWQQTVTFDALPNAPISASRTYEVFNEDGWARSLHFLAGWFFVVVGVCYFLLGIVTGHIARNLAPRGLSWRALGQELADRLRFRIRSAAGGGYGLLQRCAYAGISFVVLPFMVGSGLAMSPQLRAAYPALTQIFGSQQSARTLHFFGFALLMLFLAVHLAMVVLAGPGRRMRGMIIGR
jgi:thiosulfate reductase cytochrome b subunit